MKLSVVIPCYNEAGTIEKVMVGQIVKNTIETARGLAKLMTKQAGA